MVNFLKKHWFAVLCVLCAGILLAFDPVRNLLGAGIAGIAAILRFLESLLTGGSGTSGLSQGQTPGQALDANLATLRQRGEGEQQLTEQALNIKATGQGPNAKG